MKLYSTKQLLPVIRIAGKIIPLLLMFIGAYVLYFGCRDILRANQSRTWPTAQGVIQNSSIYRGSKGAYWAKVMYDFTVNATAFNGNRVAFGDYGSSILSHAQGVVNRYPKGKAVIVYYDPKNPQACLLEPGVKVQTWFLPGFGLVFLAISGLIAFFIQKGLRNLAAAEPGIQCDG
ncbi:MAG: DUF3592 domain-containing protein [Sedimentisphaerales bacterium]